MLEVGNALRRKGREEITLKSVCKNTITRVYYDTFQTEITILSVAKKGSTYFIKTQNPLLNAQLQEIDSNIKKDFQSQLKALGFVSHNISLRYL